MVKTSPLSETGKTDRIGVLGGTFNPPHLAHLRLAEEVAQEHNLSKIIFIPANVPPHKQTIEIASAHHRLTMTRISCEDNPLFQVSDIEINLQGPSYTINTLSILSEQEKNSNVFFILGTDSLKEIRTWKDYERLLFISNFIVVSRPGVSFESAWAEVPKEIRKRFNKQGGNFVCGTKALIPSTVKGLDISSSMIRKLVREGKTIRYLVPEPVRLYLIERDLYRNDK